MSPGGVDEALYAELMKPRTELWKKRAAEAEGERRVSYALGRAAACARTYRKKLARCAIRGTRVKCGCRGWRGVRPYTCRQHLLCERCQRSRAKRLGQRIRAGLEGALGSSPDAKMVLLTLTISHSGDPERDRSELAEGWRNFYRALHRRGWGKFPYVGVWEVTPGSDGRGHVHAHVVVLWPWRDWGVCRRLWLDACPRSERITFVARRRDGRPSDPRSAANYLGKYLAKGMQGAEFSPELRARVVAGLYNTRWVFTSRRFWVTFVPCCQRCQQRIVQAQYRWRGNPWVPPVDGDVSPRGSPQLSLEIPEPHERYRGRCA